MKVFEANILFIIKAQREVPSLIFFLYLYLKMKVYEYKLNKMDDYNN